MRLLGMVSKVERERRPKLEYSPPCSGNQVSLRVLVSRFRLFSWLGARRVRVGKKQLWAVANLLKVAVPGCQPEWVNRTSVRAQAYTYRCYFLYSSTLVLERLRWRTFRFTNALNPEISASVFEHTSEVKLVTWLPLSARSWGLAVGCFQTFQNSNGLLERITFEHRGTTVHALLWHNYLCSADTLKYSFQGSEFRPSVSQHLLYHIT